MIETFEASVVYSIIFVVIVSNIEVEQILIKQQRPDPQKKENLLGIQLQIAPKYYLLERKSFWYVLIN